LIIILAASIQN